MAKHGKQPVPVPLPKDTSLPKTVIHDLTTYIDGSIEYLVAATDAGVYPVEVKQGVNWRLIGSVAAIIIAVLALILFFSRCA
jgi:hypothetical protein